MKRLVPYLLITLAAGFTSCSDDNDQPPVKNDEPSSTVEWYTDVRFDSISVTENVQYGIDGSSHLMRIYEPVGDTRPERPVLILLGGGAFQGSNLDYLTPLAQAVCPYGIVVGVARYRSGPSSPGLEAQTMIIKGQQDSRAAVRFFKEAAKTWRVDTTNIFNGGNGTGAFLSLFSTYVQENELDSDALKFVNSVGGLEGAQGNPGHSSEVKGVVALAGGMYSSLNFIGSGEPGVFAVHGTNDTEVNYDTETSNGIQVFGSKPITEKAAAEGLPQKLILIQGGGHDAPRSQPSVYIKDLMAFLKARIAE